jgi:hypothetical protein
MDAAAIPEISNVALDPDLRLRLCLGCYMSSSAVSSGCLLMLNQSVEIEHPLAQPDAIHYRRTGKRLAVL